MRCEKASVAKRGSRLVGLDSRRNVRALGLVFALEEHPEKTEVMKQRSNEVTRRVKSIGWRLAVFPVSLVDGDVLPRFLHSASRRVRPSKVRASRSEREEKAPAPFGRNDSAGVISARGWPQSGLRKLTRWRIGDFSEDCWAVRSRG